MGLKDSRGLPVSTESDAALAHYELAAQQTAGLFGNPLATHTELTRTPARIGHRQNKHVMPLAACALRAIFGVPDRAFQQRAAQQFAGDRQFADQLLARTEDLLANHSQE